MKIYNQLAADVLAYLAGLTVPQGRFARQPFHVFPWQEKFVAGAFRADVADAGLTVARGNGKTVLCSGLLAATVYNDGPLNFPNAESLLAASSFQQAKLKPR